MIVITCQFFKQTKNQLLLKFLNYLFILLLYSDINIEEIVLIDEKFEIGMIEQILKNKRNGIKLSYSIVQLMLSLSDNHPYILKYIELYGIKDLEQYKCEIYDEIYKQI